MAIKYWQIRCNEGPCGQWLGSTAYQLPAPQYRFKAWYAWRDHHRLAGINESKISSTDACLRDGFLKSKLECIIVQNCSYEGALCTQGSACMRIMYNQSGTESTCS